ncbi:MAG: HDOD domain-containing protein [Pseudomonadales bacterium]|nr:HDOD domain-containing protein [Pseudomonadales bacterium]
MTNLNLKPDDISLAARTLTVDDIPNCSISDQLILELITDEDVDIEQLAAVIQENPSLATMIIGMANSAYFSPPSPILNTRDAIIKVLGMGMVKSVVLSVVLGPRIDLSRCPAFSVIDYWTDSLSAAKFCQKLVQQSILKKQISVDQIYLCALLAGLGELILLHHYPEEMNELIIASENNLADYVNAQKEVFGINQSEVGVLIGTRWALPEIVVTTMQRCLQADYKGDDWQVSYLVGEVILQLSRIRSGEQKLVLSPTAETILQKSSAECGLDELPPLRTDLSVIAQHLATQV